MRLAFGTLGSACHAVRALFSHWLFYSGTGTDEYTYHTKLDSKPGLFIRKINPSHELPPESSYRLTALSSQTSTLSEKRYFRPSQLTTWPTPPARNLFM
ncbi:hypothetical protein B0H19DRAFT_1138844 [Mycena capillaripes]|nr:hypothetical protein B0H19DRAFT_1138844 [Mycena capillaripes]